MPHISSSYKPKYLFKNKHFNTIYKTLFYKKTCTYERRRINTPDNDFLDLDFSLVGSDTLVIASHGLEGSSQSRYILSAVNHLNANKIDCLAVNFRGCSGSDNNHIYSYHSGKTDDLALIINYINKKYSYKKIVLLGYSMGGNITLKYLGEQNSIPNNIIGAVTFSVPCDLGGSSKALSNTNNKIYLYRFLRSLRAKSITKINKYPKSGLNKNEILKAKSFADFDNALTAPLFGFKNAEDYWKKSSSKPFLKNITIPTLLVNALDDTFLSESCHPIEIAKNSHYLFLETPKKGGHVGFNSSFVDSKNIWSEQRIIQFIKHINS